jgi:isopenicillin-N epimerase
MSDDLRDLFLLDPDIHFLNHGSYGAVPRPVFDEYVRLLTLVERQPVAFFGRRADALLADARATLAAYVNAQADDLLFVPNATTGLNMVIRGLPLAAGDEILATGHEYGALINTWQYVGQRLGTRYVARPVATPAQDVPSLVDAFWRGVTERTKVIFLSHITSPTALILPVAEVARRARQAGIMTIVDGAHVPGHLPLDLEALGVDVYAGNCHKWLSAPRGSAFLWVRPDHQHLVAPMTVSHGWTAETTYQQRHTWQGTRDLCAFLSVPAAIEFQRAHDWPAVRKRCHQLVLQARQRTADLTGVAPLSPPTTTWLGQMVALPLPACDTTSLHRRLYDEYKVEAPAFDWHGRSILRLSFQGYNDQRDLDAALAGLTRVLPEVLST